jgi:hypothetical protein
VRTGLLAAGVAVAVIGVGVLFASLSFSTGPTVTQYDPIEVSALQGHAYYTQELGGSNQSSANVDLTWASSQKLTVSVYQAVSCPGLNGVCPSGSALVDWYGDSGHWSWSGSLSFPLFLNLSNPNASPVAFAGTLLETYATSSLANPGWNLFLPLIGAAVLIAIGGVAVFLGLFLPKGVYSGDSSPGPYREEEDDDLDDLGSGPLEEDEGPPEAGPP